MKDRIKAKWLLALLSFLMLATVSLPFLQVYDLAPANTPFFIGLLAFFCFMTLVIKHHLMILPFYILSYFFTLYCYFPLHQSFGLHWLGLFIQKMLAVYSKVLAGTIHYLPDFLALSIILLLWFLLIGLFIHYERWLFGYLVLIGYTLMLAAFNHLDLGIQMILITSAALLFYTFKHVRQVHLKKKRALILYSGLTLFLIAGCSYLFMAVFPQAQNFLVTQTAGLRNYANQQGIYQHIESYDSNAASKSGFSDNDAQLGGPISDDSTVIFTAKQASKHYWRVETKNYYTGKGWKNTSTAETVSDEQTLTLSTNPEYQGPFDAETTITLSFNTPTDYLPYPYGNVSIPFDKLGPIQQIKEKERIKLLDSPETLQLTWRKPNFSQEQLQLVPDQAAQNEALTQLPPSISKRVQELAISLTAKQNTLYDKVKAVEQYLKHDSRYRYSKVDTPFTPQDEEYVDYFLFESKIGYCDNFSSAMTILLRSAGIPSRWAKGFAPGTLISGKDSEYQQYAIKHNDAHSWPEVYFEGYGWIPFEPTPGFTNDASQAVVNSSTTNSETSSTTQTTTTTNDSTSSASSSSESPTKEASQDSRSTDWLPILRTVAFGLLSFLLVIGAYFLKKYFFLLYLRLYLSTHPKQLANAYTLLLRKAEKILSRQANEPLIFYAERFEKEYLSIHGSFIQLTSLYGKTKIKEADYVGLLLHLARLLTELKKDVLD